MPNHTKLYHLLLLLQIFPRITTSVKKASYIILACQILFLQGVVVDGQDVLAVYEVAKEAVERARRGEGPTLIEAKTYRYKGHFEGDPQVYRSKEEIEWWMKHKDPIKIFEQKLISRGIVTKEELEKIWEKVKKEVDEAIKYAEESPYPDVKDLTKDVFSTPTKGVLVWEWPI